MGDEFITQCLGGSTVDHTIMKYSTLSKHPPIEKTIDIQNEVPPRNWIRNYIFKIDCK